MVTSDICHLFPGSFSFRSCVYCKFVTHSQNSIRMIDTNYPTVVSGLWKRHGVKLGSDRIGCHALRPRWQLSTEARQCSPHTLTAPPLIPLYMSWKKMLDFIDWLMNWLIYLFLTVIFVAYIFFSHVIQSPVHMENPILLFNYFTQSVIGNMLGEARCMSLIFFFFFLTALLKKMVC